MSPRRTAVKALAALTACALLALVSSAPAAAEQRLYVTSTSGELAMLGLDSAGVPAPIGGSPLTGLGQIEAVVVSPDASHLYVARRSTSGVLGFTIGADGGLTPIAGSPWPAAGEIYALALTPDGQRLYAAGRGGGTDLYGFSIGADGALAPLTGSPYTVRAGARGIAISADGSLLFEVANLASQLGVYSIGPGGALTEAPGSPYSIGLNSFGVSVTPDGRFVYVASANGNRTYGFSIGPGVGLAPLPGSPYLAPDGTFDGAIAPKGDGYYAASAGPDLLGGFSIGGDGALAPVTGSPYPLPNSGRSVTVNSDGERVYTTNASTTALSAYARGPAGELSPIAGSPYNVGLSSPDFRSLALTPAQPANASLAVVASPKRPRTILDAGASTDPDGQVAGYSWDFGDGAAVTTASPTNVHVYAADGTYSASVTVIDDDGCAAARVYTGQMDLCNGGAAATATAVVGPAPSTKLKRKPARRLVIRRGKRVKVKLKFKSDTPGAAFQCTLDGKPKACTSPFKVKVKKGRHKFTVAASARGLADFTPAKAKFKAKRRR